MMTEINVEDVVHSLSKKLDSARALPFRSGVYKTPERLRKYNGVAPNLVSIGPFHRGRERLKAAEEMKICYLKGLCALNDNILAELVLKIKRQESHFRDFYEETLDLSSDEFVEMMLVDGCFIILLLRENLRRQQDDDDDDDDVIFSTPRMLSRLKNDLLLVENQLPWEFLKDLFDIIIAQIDYARPSLQHLVRLFFQNPTLPQPQQFEIETQMAVNLDDEWGTTHLLEVARKFVVEPYLENMNHIEYRTPIPSVTELKEIGVTFVPAVSKKTQLDIVFRNGVMEIPPIKIGENGESFLRNLIAYEQYSPKPEQCHMSSYAILFSQLIKSVEDADILIRTEIITTELSKVSTASFFSRLSNGIEPIGFIYCDLAKGVNAYLKSRWLRTWAITIKRDYLYNPSSFWSVSNGVAVILILTLMQTLYTVLSYYKKEGK